MTMRKALASFLLLLFIPGALAETIGITMNIGETIKVNGSNITLVDISSTGSIALRVNETLYVLDFGDSVKVGNLTVIVGSIFPNRQQARLFFIGKNISLLGGEPKVELTSMVRKVLLSPGEKVGLSIEVKNLGEDSYVPLSVNVPEGWTGKLTFGNTEVLGVYLRHGESVGLTLELKAGSEPGTYRIKVGAGDSTLEITAVVTGNALQAYVDFPGKEATAGSNVSFTLHLSSEAPVDVPLSADAPVGWNVKFIALGSPVRIVRVSGERSIEVLVEIPSNASVGAHSVTINAGNESLNLLVYVTETHAGENGTLSVKVIDEESGNYVGGAKVILTGNGVNESATTLPDGTAVLKAPEGNYKLSVSKEAYKSVEMRVKLKAGEKTSVTVNLEKLPYYFDVLVPAPSESQILGKNFIYEVIIQNLGKEGDTYSLSLTMPKNWGGMIVESPDSRTGISSTYVESGGEKRLYVILIPPDNAELGNYTANLTVKSLGSDVAKRVILRAMLMGSYGMSVSLEKYSVEVKSGEETELRAKVYNTGTSPLTNVRIKVDAPKGWRVEVSPDRMASLGRDGVATFTVKINIPSDVDAGDYYVKITAMSDQKQSSEQVRITVTKGSGTTYAGLAMVFIAVLLLAFILKRYGRR
ncbi:conserved exported protein of unknown function [Thermococcus nautili]|uniref:COG1470 family protein n=1 Tax=Thermococcus nautili TaxID=195522 RepID=UPI00255366B3|nr:NEW3 domain-containing protein [Thermococcus nautili]CAI1492545.1 conserved exported protein of unknown function [Thermococcus nautili]